MTATKAYLAQNQASPPPDSSQYVSLPNGTIETKAAWRPLNAAEAKSGRFHMQRVRFYEASGSGYCYRDATWGLVALHIIQKTPSAPYFVYATFEQADNIQTTGGQPVEDTDGNLRQPAPATATTPQVCLQDPTPPTTPPQSPEVPSNLGQVILTNDPKTCMPASAPTYCTAPGSRLYYRNETTQAAEGGNICVNKRDNDIPQYAIDANKAAHAAITAYLKEFGVAWLVPWLCR